jgi:hypothetical protein
MVITDGKTLGTEKLTQSQKNSEGKQYYKDRINNNAVIPFFRATTSFTTFTDAGYDSDEYESMKRWYDLYNGRIDMNHFRHYCQKNSVARFAGVSESIINRDIVSSRIDTIIGIEKRRPFRYKAVAVNPEATTMREQQENSMLQEYLMAKVGGKDVPREQLPPEIRKYMSRKYQTPQEVMANQVLEIGRRRQDFEYKFLKGLKHLAIAYREVYLIAPKNGEPAIEVVNPMYFHADLGHDNEFIHKGNSATAYYMLHPSAVAHAFKDELTNKQIEDLFSRASLDSHRFDEYSTPDPANWGYDGYVPVVHHVWRGLRKVGFLTYLGLDGTEQEKIVSENYRVNKEAGDIKIKWEWVEEIHEGYRIYDDVFVRCRPVPYQHALTGDLASPWLPYVGGVYDFLNSKPVSKIGRMETYQYFYNVMLSKVDELVASDKGKKLGLDMSAIPASLGVGLKELIAHMQEDDIIPLNSNEEGQRGRQSQSSINGMLSAIDLSQTSQIQAYQQLAEYAYTKAGEVIGITPQMEGFVKEREAVSNVENSIILSNSKLEPFYHFHDTIKKDVLMSYLKLAQLMYYDNPPTYLAYATDDMSVSLLELEPEQFLAAQYVIYINDSSKTHDAQMMLDRYLQAAMQNQTVSPSAALSALRQESFAEAEEILSMSEEEQQMRQQEMMKMEQEAKMVEFEMNEAAAQANHERTLKEIKVKESERRQTEIAKQMIFSMGFDPEKDKDNNRIADIEELGTDLLEDARKVAEEIDTKMANKEVAPEN